MPPAHLTTSIYNVNVCVFFLKAIVEIRYDSNLKPIQSAVNLGNSSICTIELAEHLAGKPYPVCCLISFCKNVAISGCVVWHWASSIKFPMFDKFVQLLFRAAMTLEAYS